MTLHDHRIRFLHLLILLFVACLPAAQAQLFLFTAHITESVPDTSAKPLFSAITTAYPDAELFHHRDRDTLVILTAHMILFEDLANLVAPTGFTLVDLDRDFLLLTGDPGSPAVPALRDESPAALDQHRKACILWARENEHAYSMLVQQARKLYRP